MLYTHYSDLQIPSRMAVLHPEASRLVRGETLCTTDVLSPPLRPMLLHYIVLKKSTESAIGNCAFRTVLSRSAAHRIITGLAHQPAGAYTMPLSRLAMASSGTRRLP